MVEKQTYSIREAAQLLGVGRITLAKAVRSGRIPVLRLSSKRVLIPRNVIVNMLADPASWQAYVVLQSATEGYTPKLKCEITD